ncbi:MAG: hypothetical protein ACOYMG_12425, partial [Candidatus Methylumidiphilus sp.]
ILRSNAGQRIPPHLNPSGIVLIFRWFPSSSLETHDVGAFTTTFPSWRSGMGKQEKKHKEKSQKPGKACYTLH